MTTKSMVPLQNRNFLTALQAEFFVKRLPTVNFTCQASAVPGIFMQGTEQETPLVNIPLEGDTVFFEDLPVTFLVDEYMQNWMEIYDWIIALGFPEDTEQYKPLTLAPAWSGTGRYSDATLLLLDSKSIPKIEVTFFDMLPQSLTSITLDTRSETETYVTATAVFRYRNYAIQRISTTSDLPADISA